MLRLRRPRCRDLVLKVHLVASPPCSKTCQSICALYNTTIKEPRRTYKLTENGKRYKGSFSILHWCYESMLVRFSEKIKLDIANMHAITNVRGSGCTRTTKCSQKWQQFKMKLYSSLSLSFNQFPNFLFSTDHVLKTYPSK